MKKIDLKKELREFYNASTKEVVTVEVPQMNFLMIDGEGDPNGSASFHASVEALFSVSYTMKFMVKKSMAIDYGVMPLEGLWWADDMSKFSTGDKSAWKWTLMIMQPEYITQSLLEEAISEVEKKKGLAALSLLRFGPFREGKAAQIMHAGPFTEEGPAIEKVHAYIRNAGSELRGRHHEIYLSDIRKAAPEKWKTIIRQPMK